MYEETASCHFVLFKGIGDGYLILGNEPYVAVDTAVVGKVQRHLFLARRVGLVVAVVGFDGNDNIIAYLTAGERNGDGQVSALVFLHQLSIHIDRLLTHDGLEVQGDVAPRALLWQTEVLAIPGYALIVSAAAGFGRHQLNAMRC